MRRFLIVAVALAIVASASPTRAESAWDGDDVDSPLDFRWFSARVTEDEIVLVISFYRDFSPQKLPRLRGNPYGDRSVYVSGLPADEGYFARREDGRIVYIHGDFGSVCCTRTRVRQPEPDVLRVVMGPSPYDEGPYSVRAWSSWPADPRPIRDRTKAVDSG